MEKLQDNLGRRNLEDRRQVLIALLRNRFIYIILIRMDSRLRKEGGIGNVMDMESDKLTDSLIYNIIKKMETKMTMEEKYEEARTPQIKLLPPAFGRYIHSTTAMGYFGLVMTSMLYMRFKNKAKISLASIIPHAIIAVSINEYQRYRNIMNINPELTNEFRSYQKNTRSIIAEKKSRVSLQQEIQKLKIITFSKLVSLVKYKPLY